MTDIAKDEDNIQFDALEAKIYDTLSDISDKFQELNTFVDRLQKLGIPAAERRNLECEIRKVFGDRRYSLTLDISKAAHAAVKAAKTAAKSNTA